MVAGEPTPFTAREWSPWGDRLLAALVVGLGLSLAWAWTMQYADPSGMADFIGLSYAAVDPTWMPPGVTHPYPLWGVHYFGDMWYHIGFGEAQTPYIIAGRPAQYVPIAIYVFKAWGIFGYPAALALMTVLNLGLISIYAWVMLRAVAPSRKVVIIALAVVLTGPMLVTLDRGGHQLIAVGLMAWALYLYARGREWWAVILMVVVLFFRTGIMGDKEFSWDRIAARCKKLFGGKKAAVSGGENHE